MQVTIPQVSLLDIEPYGNNSINFTTSGMIDAGDALVFEPNTDTWLNYTSCVGINQNRKIMVQITSGILQTGIELILEPAVTSGLNGICGTAASVILGYDAKDFINGIRGCYTGDGVHSGIQLKISVHLNDFGAIRAGTLDPVQLTYTMISY